MALTNRLRVAIPDGTDALEIVTNKVEEVIGLQVEPLFQELDHEDLIVEMQLARSVRAGPAALPGTGRKRNRVRVGWGPPSREAPPQEPYVRLSTHTARPQRPLNGTSFSEAIFRSLPSRACKSV